MPAADVLVLLDAESGRCHLQIDVLHASRSSTSRHDVHSKTVAPGRLFARLDLATLWNAASARRLFVHPAMYWYNFLAAVMVTTRAGWSGWARSLGNDAKKMQRRVADASRHCDGPWQATAGLERGVLDGVFGVLG